MSQSLLHGASNGRKEGRELLVEAFKTSQAVNAEIAGKNAEFKALHASWDKFRLDTSI